MFSNSQMPSPKEAEILEMLMDGRERYGLEMVKVSSGAVKRGTVYVLLARLEEKGFVTARIEPNDTLSGLPRRLYRITGHGRSTISARNAAQAAFDAAFVPAGG